MVARDGERFEQILESLATKLKNNPDDLETMAGYAPRLYLKFRAELRAYEAGQSSTAPYIGDIHKAVQILQTLHGARPESELFQTFLECSLSLRDHYQDRWSSRLETMHEPEDHFHEDRKEAESSATTAEAPRDFSSRQVSAAIPQKNLPLEPPTEPTPPEPTSPETGHSELPRQSLEKREATANEEPLAGPVDRTLLQPEDLVKKDDPSTRGLNWRQRFVSAPIFLVTTVIAGIAIIWIFSLMTAPNQGTSAGSSQRTVSPPETGQLRIELTTEAEVIVDGWQVQTGAKLFFDKLSPGNHRVVAQKQGYFREERRIIIQPGQTLEISIGLTKKGW